jgi:xanthine/uracil permease
LHDKRATYTGGLSAMVIGTITPPLILAGILKFSPETTAYLIRAV